MVKPDMTGKIVAPVTSNVKEGMMTRSSGLIVERIGARGSLGTPSITTGLTPPLWSATIRGEPPSRARMHEAVLAGGIARLVKSHPARLWQNGALTQLLNRRPERPLAGELTLECRIWTATPQGDLDDALLLEVLERAAVIANARQIREKHVFAALDRDDPRLSVRLVRCGGAP
jgi:hypothetical protein